MSWGFDGIVQRITTAIKDSVSRVMAQAEENMALIKKYAPVLSFHPREGGQCCYPGNAEEAYELIRTNRFSENRTPRTMNENAPCYFQFLPNFSFLMAPNLTRIKYWFWYNFNDFPQGPDIAGSHEGDWEAVEVILTNNVPYVFFLSNHKGFIQKWPEEMIMVNNTHPKVWVGNGSHANYPSPNYQPYCLDVGFTSYCDEIADGGSVWYTENNLVNIRNTNFGRDNYLFLWGCHDYSMIEGQPPLSPLARQFDYSIPTNFYKIIICTGNVPNAGTDANVKITLYGTLGRSIEIPLGNSGTATLEGIIDMVGLPNPFYDTLFERNTTNIFSPGLVYLGEINKIDIGHDNFGRLPAWYLDKVIIENRISKTRTVFPCNQWLAKYEGDRKIKRTLTPASS